MTQILVLISFQPYRKHHRNGEYHHRLDKIPIALQSTLKVFLLRFPEQKRLLLHDVLTH